MKESNSGIWVIMADIHANFPALRKVHEDARLEARKISFPEDQLRYISLGDVVDYGPDPVKCLQWVETHCDVTLRGNHDFECSRCPRALPAVRRVSRKHWPVTVWTRCKLEEAGLRQILHYWPLTLTETFPGLPIALAHADFTGGEDQSLQFQPRRYDWIYNNLFKPMHALGAKYGFVGHSHQQLMFQHIPDATPGTCFPLSDSEMYSSDWLPFPGSDSDSFLINPGSVGQPRPIDEYAGLDSRAQYMLLDVRDSQVRYKFRRVAYSKEKTAALIDEKIKLTESIPENCGNPEARFVLLSIRQIGQLRAGLEHQLFLLKLALGVDTT